ncbi:DUF6152 family protein [Sphaerotilus mobilis]|uniref:Copper(I)-binding protein n=1 Tax=Sphaerotilus mobilis TaxID=47994 RepID=A0A4Q7LGA4_9BURK|nr:DUF6152 family protein [Sphaerotilus mobilis]RZS52259.1 hypothetical protein EV685_3450 [Sphaerotilus mobilis]
MHRRLFITSPLLLALPAGAHHGWSSFDQNRPIYLEGKVAQVAWRNPHVELTLELPVDGLTMPADLATRSLPAQSAPVDGPALLKAAQLPTRKDRRWEIELAPLSRVQAWGLPEIKAGDALAMLGFTFAGEKGQAILRVEYLFAAGKAYGMRSSPA